MRRSLAEMLLDDSFPVPSSVIIPEGTFGLSLDSLIKDRFYDFRRTYIAGNVEVFVGDPELPPEEVDEYINQVYQTTFFYDRNNNDRFDAGTDEFIAKAKIFICRDGTWLLEQYEALGSLEDNEFAVFLEDNSGDLFSGAILRIKAGKNLLPIKNEDDSIDSRGTIKVRKVLESDVFSNRYFNLTPDQVDEIIKILNDTESLFEWFYDLYLELADKFYEGIISIVGSLSDWLTEKLRITEKTWNAAHPEYKKDILFTLFKALLQKFNNDVTTYLESGQLPAVARHMLSFALHFTRVAEVLLTEIEKAIEKFFALLCGFWNGLVDLITGIIELIRLVFVGISESTKLLERQYYYKALASEYFDNTLQALVKLDWNVLFMHVANEFVEVNYFLNVELPKKLVEKLLSLNHTELGYYYGYLLFQVLEFILPPLKIAKLSKLSKIGKIENVTEVFGDAAAAQRGLDLPRKMEDSKAAELFFDTAKQFNKILDEGTGSVVREIDKIDQALEKWVDDLLGIEAEKAVKLAEAADLLGLAHRKKIIDDVENEKVDLRKGQKDGNYVREANYAEIKADFEFLSKEWTINGRTGTFKRISSETTQTIDDPIRKGIDGIYEFSNPPPKYVVNEVKYNTAQLSKKVTGSGGSQMTRAWITHNIRMSFESEVAYEILSSHYERILTKVSRQGEVSFEQLNETARTISKTWPKQ